MTTRVFHATVVCDYASCERPGTEPADTWMFCTSHLAEHYALLGTTPHQAAYAKKLADIKALHAAGLTDQQIAAQLAVSKSVVANSRRKMALAANALSVDPATDCGGKHRAWWDPTVAHCLACTALRRAGDRRRYQQRRNGDAA